MYMASISSSSSPTSTGDSIREKGGFAGSNRNRMPDTCGKHPSCAGIRDTPASSAATNVLPGTSFDTTVSVYGNMENKSFMRMVGPRTFTRQVGRHPRGQHQQQTHCSARAHGHVRHRHGRYQPAPTQRLPSCALAGHHTPNCPSWFHGFGSGSDDRSAESMHTYDTV